MVKYLTFNHLAQEQKNQVAEKIMDLGNIAMGALTFGQIVSGTGFNLPIALTGLFLLISAYIWALWIMKGGDKNDRR